MSKTNMTVEDKELGSLMEIKNTKD